MDFNFQVDWNYYFDLRQTFLAFGRQLAECDDYKQNKTREEKKEHLW